MKVVFALVILAVAAYANPIEQKEAPAEQPEGAIDLSESSQELDGHHHLHIPHHLPHHLPIPKHILKGKLCGICKLAVKEGEKQGEKYSKQWLHEKVDKYCDALAILAHECKKEVNKIIDKLEGYILKKESPETACKQLHFC